MSEYQGKSLVQRFAGDSRGAIAILSAAVLPVIVGAAALAVDIGSIYLARRTAQGAVDLAALSAASNMAKATEAANGTIAANSIPGVKTVSVIKGHYTADISISPELRFVPNMAPFNAVRVVLEKTSPTFFGKIFGEVEKRMSVASTATSMDEAAFSVGSRLLAVRDGLVNNLLGSLLGGNISLSVMDYESLLKADVDLLKTMDALATELHLTAGTYQDVLNSNVTVGQLISALANVEGAQGNTPAQLVLKSLLAQSQASRLNLPLKSMVDLGNQAQLGIGQASSGFSTAFSALEIVNAAALIANGGKQVSLGLNLGIPGVSKLTLDIAIGEPMQYSGWLALGQSSAKVRTAQTKVRLQAEVGGSGLLALAKIKLPIYAEVAYADASLAGVTCDQDGNNRQATVNVTPGIARVAIADVDNASFASPTMWQTLKPAQLVTLPLIGVRALSVISLGNPLATALVFTQADVDAGTIKRAETNSLVSSLVTSLLKTMDLDVSVGPLVLGGVSAVTSSLLSSLNLVAKPLDDVLFSVLTLLGVHVGEADVRVHGIRCGAPVLSG